MLVSCQWVLGKFSSSDQSEQGAVLSNFTVSCAGHSQGRYTLGCSGDLGAVMGGCNMHGCPKDKGQGDINGPVVETKQIGFINFESVTTAGFSFYSMLMVGILFCVGCFCIECSCQGVTRSLNAICSFRGQASAHLSPHMGQPVPLIGQSAPALSPTQIFEVPGLYQGQPTNPPPSFVNPLYVSQATGPWGQPLSRRAAFSMPHLAATSGPTLAITEA